MQHRLALIGKAAGAIRHQALALGFPDRLAEIGFRIKAIIAFAALGRVERNHMIADGERGDALAHFHNNARAFMSQNDRKETLGIITGQSERIRVANARRLHLDQHFTRPRTLQLNSLNFKRLSHLKCHRRTHVHHITPCSYYRSKSRVELLQPRFNALSIHPEI